jgi:uncharacterized phage-associated protein
MPDRVYDSRGVANYLILKSGGTLDALQVMKLTYISHGFNLGITGRPLLEDDVEAWKLGPVVRRIYGHLPGGSSPIVGSLSSYSDVADLEDGEKTVVDAILSAYGKLSGLRLSSLTHRPGSPWERTWNTYGKNAVIPQDLIRVHYEGIVEQYRESQASNKPYSVEAF